MNECVTKRDSKFVRQRIGSLDIFIIGALRTTFLLPLLPTLFTDLLNTKHRIVSHRLYSIYVYSCQTICFIVTQQPCICVQSAM